MSNKDVVTSEYSLLFGDCLERMKEIPDASADAIICDPPFGTTACAWDSVIPFDLMWEQLKRIIKPNGAIVLFGNEPFSSALRMSNIKQYKYDWVWIKNRPTGSQHARNKPMNKFENISVFSLGSMGHKSLLGSKRLEYNPQGVVNTGKTKIVKSKGFHGNHIGARPKQVGREYEVFTGFPDNVLFFNKEENHLHPTQKPVALLEYLIKTYTQESETVLDFTFGSCSTGVACLNTNRKFVGIEMDEGYFDIGVNRMQESIIKGEIK